jgi:GTP-binding protein
MKETMPTGRYAEYMEATFPMLDYMPLAFITAIKGKNIWKLLNLAQNLHQQASTRVSTGDLNRIIQAAIKAQSPPVRQKRAARILYATQATTNPPTIVLFTNGASLFDPTYQRFLLKYLRKRTPFKDVPVRLHFRTKREGDVPEGGWVPVRLHFRTKREGDVPEGGWVPELIEPIEPAVPEEIEEPKPPGSQVDISNLEFTSDVTDEELDQASKRKHDELWNI